MDQIGAVTDELRGIAERTGRTSFRSCRQGRNEHGVVIPSSLAPIADAKAVRCRAAANDVMGQNRKFFQVQGSGSARCAEHVSAGGLNGSPGYTTEAGPQWTNLAQGGQWSGAVLSVESDGPKFCNVLDAYIERAKSRR